MDFRITGLSPQPFRDLYGASDDELAARGAIRKIVDDHPGYPDRITLRDVPIGKTVLLLNHVSQPDDTPYRASHAIFVWEGATERYDRINEVPEVMRRRLLSLRAFDDEGMMLDADVVEGAEIERLIERMFGNDRVGFVHVHNARQGCFAGRVDRTGFMSTAVANLAAQAELERSEFRRR